VKIKVDENLPDRLVSVLNALVERVSTVFQTERVEEWTGCLVVATEQKIRSRRPEQPTEP
jgi:hypothetical protein